jgi:hypothetical protein
VSFNYCNAPNFIYLCQSLNTLPKRFKHELITRDVTQLVTSVIESLNSNILCVNVLSLTPKIYSKIFYKVCTSSNLTTMCPNVNLLLQKCIISLVTIYPLSCLLEGSVCLLFLLSFVRFVYCLVFCLVCLLSCSLLGSMPDALSTVKCASCLSSERYTRRPLFCTLCRESELSCLLEGVLADLLSCREYTALSVSRVWMLSVHWKVCLLSSPLQGVHIY